MNVSICIVFLRTYPEVKYITDEQIKVNGISKLIIKKDVSYCPMINY